MNLMRHRLLLPAALALAFATGCASRRLEPVVPMPVNIVSRQPFAVHVAATATTPANWCYHTRVRAKIADVRSDTMFFASVHSERRPMTSSDCVAGGPGFLVLSSAPDARVEVARVDPWKGAAPLLLFVPVVTLFTLFLFSFG